MQSLELSLPEKSGIGMQIVHEVHSPRPHLPSVVFIRIYTIFEENVHFLTSQHGLAIVDGHSHVQKRHKVQFFIFDQSIELFGRMGVFVDSEDHLPVHVLQIRPESVQRNVILVVFPHHLFNLRKRFIPPTTLVETKTPKRRNVPATDVFVVSL